MTDHDDAAVERVARWVCIFDGHDPEALWRRKFSDTQFSGPTYTWRQYISHAREIIALLTPPPDPV